MDLDYHNQNHPHKTYWLLQHYSLSHKQCFQYDADDWVYAPVYIHDRPFRRQYLNDYWSTHQRAISLPKFNIRILFLCAFQQHYDIPTGTRFKYNTHDSEQHAPVSKAIELNSKLDRYGNWYPTAANGHRFHFYQFQLLDRRLDSISSLDA
ncbi:hypothetical protein FZEAL_7782 [Fusarium zealandicum]|uniref:Uncharacterized protein n=1 Tax=Fusarium zealandicum TaxID=1053134 RepID=A0A8H4UFF5_9HYPO|nr:hypothetical protein FZEAL_7782 [Fusarium zealandicum]